MKKTTEPYHNRQRILYTVAILFWLCWLTQHGDPYQEKSYTERYHQFSSYIPYLLVGFFSFYCLHLDDRKPLTCFQTVVIGFGSCVFSLAVTLANYEIIPNPLMFFSYFILGSMIIYPTFRYAVNRQWKLLPAEGIDRSRTIFLISMIICTGIDLLILFNCYYPGILTPDSIGQIGQIMSGSYSNHHPFYHSQIIRLLLNLGFALFGDMNRAVACYSIFQIFVMSATFSYVLLTLHQRGVPNTWLCCCLLWYALMPFHVMYSFTMWKDVLWGGTTALFICALYRRFFSIGHSKLLDIVLLAISGVGFCLLRSNGWIAFAVLTILYLIFFAKKNPKLAMLLSFVLIISWGMKNPLLAYWNVPQPDTIESLSIPAQQIARVVVDGHALSEDEYQLLNQIIDVEKIPDTYRAFISDPIKALVRERGNQSALVAQWREYLTLWLRLGIEHPLAYIRAWVDQTKGYWNSGYDYWIWDSGVYLNDLNIYQEIKNVSLRQLWDRYMVLFSNNFLCIFTAIGFHVWIIAGTFVVNIARGCRKAAFLSLPLLAIVATLMIATPVYSEFRYAYAIFTSIPIVILSFFETSELEEHK